MSDGTMNEISKKKALIREYADGVKACEVGLSVLADWEHNPLINQNDDGSYSLVLNLPSEYSSNVRISCGNKGIWMGTGGICDLEFFSSATLKEFGETPMLAALALVDKMKRVFDGEKGSFSGYKNIAEYDLGALELQLEMEMDFDSREKNDED